MQNVQADRGTAPLRPQEAEAMRRWIECYGEQVVVEETGLSRLTIARCVAMLPVHAGSRAAARAALARRRPA